MKVVSFDVGIKNMAYCVLHHSALKMPNGNVTFNSFVADESALQMRKGVSVNDRDEKDPGCLEIIDWNVVDLMDTSDNVDVTKKCTVTLKNKKICGRKSKYEKGEHCFCEKHAKTCEYIIPNKECSPAYFKKLKIGELQQKMVDSGIPGMLTSDKRPQLLEKIQNYYTNHCLVLIVTKKKRADECSLISIGQRIKQLFDAIPAMRDVTHVIIENQISSIASRMSIIQGLLTQYFIMRHDDTVIDPLWDSTLTTPTHKPPLVLEFISSKNKLKMFSEKQIVTKTTTTSQKYRQHKTDSIAYSKQILEKYPKLGSWLPVLDTTKKDDLADCFLQGIWYVYKDKNVLS
jgi:hypothetical protein